MAAINLPFAASATKRAPNTDELANGFPCGDADKQLFDWLEWWLTGQIGAAIAEGGLTVDDALLPRLAQAIQSGRSTYAVATGTANAWVVAPSLAVPAYAAGRVLWIKAPATNTSTTVNMNVSTLGNRRVKKADGSDPAVGDLVSGVWYPTIDDGTNICVVKNLPSDIVAAPRVAPVQALIAPSASNTIPSGLSSTKITNFGTITNNISDLATWATARLTIIKDGYYNLGITLDTNLLQGTSGYGAAYSIGKNGANSIVGNNIYSNSSMPYGPFGSASGIFRLVAGDYLEVFATQNIGSPQDMPIRFTAKYEGV